VMRRLSSLCYKDVSEIRTLCEVHPQYRVAMLYDVHESTISRARRGISWSQTDEQLAAKPHRPAAKLTPSQVAAIRRLSNTVRHSELAGMFGINRSTVWSIVNRRTWRDAP
jgi:hypothetical protein